MELLICFALAYAITDSIGQTTSNVAAVMRGYPPPFQGGQRVATGGKGAAGTTAYAGGYGLAGAASFLWSWLRDGAKAGWGRGIGKYHAWSDKRRIKKGAATGTGRGEGLGGWKATGPTDAPTVDAYQQAADQSTTAVREKHARAVAGQTVGTSADLVSQDSTARVGNERKDNNPMRTAASSVSSGEAATIDAAKRFLTDTATHIRGEVAAQLEVCQAQLATADMDSESLASLASVHEQATALAAALDAAVKGIDDRHAAMEDAVNSTSHAAKTEFYRHQ